ncbi:hypothetical protein [Aeromonas salmonicida]|uniref:hypothetical protein n=1 Tax=Aeromonas salmonicida TaxID=645 RepID=UPI003D31C9C3
MKKQIQVTLNTAINADNMKLIADKIYKRVDDMIYYPVFVSAKVKRRKDVKTGEAYYYIKPYYFYGKDEEAATPEHIRVYQDRVSIYDAQFERNSVNASGAVKNDSSSFMMAIVLKTISDFSTPVELAVDFASALHDHISTCVDHYDVSRTMSLKSIVDKYDFELFFDGFLNGPKGNFCWFTIRSKTAVVKSDSNINFGDVGYDRDGTYRYGSDLEYMRHKAWDSINRDIQKAIQMLKDKELFNQEN